MSKENSDSGIDGELRIESEPLQSPEIGALTWILRRLNGVENVILSTVLGAMVLLPLAEIVLRTTLRTGIAASSTIVQHLTLIVGMLGGAIAARESRLLSISTISHFLKGIPGTIVSVFAQSAAAAVTFYLMLASIELIQTEKEAGQVLAYGIPVWVVQSILTVGFFLIGIRLIWTSAKSWPGRIAACLIVGLFLWADLWSRLDYGPFLIVTLGLLLLSTLLGAPVFTTISGATLVLLWAEGLPVASIPLKHYSLVTHPSLPAIPMFTLAGYFLAEGGASRRLVGVFNSLLGQIRGGPAIVTALVCAIFTAVTGASGVTILALGAILMPVLIRSKFSERDALGLLTSAGSLGTILPPCITLILYAVTANTIMANMGMTDAMTSSITLEKMFLAGIIPGFLLIGLTAWWGILKGTSIREEGKKFQLSEALRAIGEAKWELFMPVVALVTLFGGFATPVEAAAATALYAFIIETFIYKDLSLRKDLVRVMTECGLLIGGILLILGVAMGFSHYLIFQEIPDQIVEWITRAIHSRWLFLLILNVFLLLVGCLMDIFSAIVVIVPLIIPLGIAFDIHPLHLGIIFLANLELGYLTPPVGMNLFLASYRFGKSMPTVIRAVIPLFFVRLFGVLLITYIPHLCLFLPSLWD